MARNQGDVVLVFSEPDVDALPCSKVSCAPQGLIVGRGQDLSRARHHAQGVHADRTTERTDDDVAMFRSHVRTPLCRPVQLLIPQGHEVLQPFHEDVIQVRAMTVITPSPVVAFRVNWALMVP